MATIKSFTDIEQSRKLAEILPIESADMCYINGDSGKISIVEWGNNVHDEDDIPCWSLATLLGVLPKIHGVKPILDLEENSIQYSGMDFYVVTENLVNACYELILKLNELKML